MQEQIARAMKSYSAGEFSRARSLFHTIAASSEEPGYERTAAMNWNNAGACSIALMQYRAALTDFTRAKKIAAASGQTAALANTLNNLASLYLQTGQPENARSVAAEGLYLPQAAVDPGVRAKTRFQLAFALMQMNRFDEAEPIYLRSINELLDQNDLDAAARELGLFGDELLRGNRMYEAEWALSEGFRLTRIHHLRGSANILRGLAKLKSAQGNRTAAAMLFDEALTDPSSPTPRWSVLADRGKFRLEEGNIEGSIDDFRQARRIAFQVRADMVPADGDRVAVENGLSGVMQGFVQAGNLLAQRSGNESLPRETFDAAEQDRLWSLRALLPAADDWRKRLPEHYWELLARYQSIERASVAGGSPQFAEQAGPLEREMQQIEAGAAGTQPRSAVAATSALAHVQATLDSDSVLLSFHVTQTSSWIWAVDRHHTRVYPLPPIGDLRADVSEFKEAIGSGTSSAAAGRRLYRSLFGQIPGAVLSHKRWLIEPDGPLNELPFAALTADEDAYGRPVYLIERAALQFVPSALLVERGRIRLEGNFLGIGDPVYNFADARFAAPRLDGRGRSPQLTLARLPNTLCEIQACARAWGTGRSRSLSGGEARIETVQNAIGENPAVIHFATHVVSFPGEFRSGLIALSLGSDGGMGLLGPKEILARSVAGALVVMDGCHSGQGETLPATGLMGLTRAWIGAGASAVLSTQWDVPDEAAQSIMTNFYLSLKKSPEKGVAFALQAAQMSELRAGKARQFPRQWAGYSLLSRIQ